MKVLAYNLPAFHRIPENDEWWGEGFTEWDNTRKGKPLFKGHVQPMTPINGYFYDLSKKEDVINQAILAKKYGLYGFVYYHYWFTGHKLFEKPVEIFRDSENIDFHYCLCWANETWTRTWDGKPGQVLLEQTFGDKKDWENHLQYFLRFFTDKRYILRNNSPMLFVYSARNIPCIDEMVAYWNNRIKEYGFDSIYLVELINTPNPDPSCKFSNAVTEFEPMYTDRYRISPLIKLYRGFCKKLKITEYLNYDYVWKKILSREKTYEGRENILGAYTSWDNTPRKGKSGLIHKGASPEKFERYFRKMLKDKRAGVSKEFCVINAWNEWGEGPVLEPSEQYKYRYLEGLQRVISEFNN